MRVCIIGASGKLGQYWCSVRRDEHMLLGLLSVHESLAAHVLSEFGVTLPKVEAIIARPGE